MSVGILDQSNRSSESVAILHDRIPGLGGGETFSFEAARVLDAPIYTMYVASGVDLPDDVEVIPIHQSKYASGLSGRFLEWKNEGMNPFETASVAMDMTDGHPDLADYDIVLESAPLSKFYVPEVDQTILHYPHSPPRWLYDLYRDRLSNFDYPGIQFALKSYAKLWRALDKEANDYVDQFVANSELVRDRIRRFYGRDAAVIYPPVVGNWYDDRDDGYFITWSRLAPEKRIDMIAEAFTGLDERLLIAGDGEQREEIERIAQGHDNVEVLGYVEDVERLVSRATAVVYAPKQEDFGLVGAEALTAGKPLLGVNEGFTRYQVVEGQTGLTFEPTVESLRETVRAFDPDDFDSAEIRDFAARYQYDTFARNLLAVVERAHSENDRGRPIQEIDDTETPYVS